MIKERIFKSAILKNLFANFYGVAVNLFNQILLVPFYLTLWGVSKYGDWIVLTAVSSLFSISDIGLNTVTSNRFAMKLAEGNIKECNWLLTNNIILLFIVSFIVLIGTTIFAFCADIVSVLGLHITDLSSARYVFIILIVKIFIGMFGGVFNTIYRANSIASKAFYIDNTSRLLDGLILIFGLLLKLSMEMIVTLYLLPKLISVFYKMVDIQKMFYFRFSLTNFNPKLMKEVMLPSFSFLSFPVGNAVILQGFALFVNKTFGANELVLFTTTRTLCNFVKTIMATISNAIWPEFSIAYGKKEYQRLRKIHRYALFSSFTISVLISLALMFFGKFIYVWWTRGEIQFDIYVMSSFLLVLVVNNIWYTSSITLMATNKHSFLGMLYLFSILLSLLVAFLLNTMWYHSLVVTVLCLLIVDVFLSAYVLRRSLELTKDSLRAIFLKLSKEKSEQNVK